MKDFKIDIKDSIKYNNSKTILLEFNKLSINDLPKQYSFENMTLYLKDEFHITLIGNEDSLQLQNKNFDYEKIKNKISDIVKRSFLNFNNEFHILKKNYSDLETRVSLIQTLDTDIIDNFRNFMNTEYGITFSNNNPKPHITIYKQKENQGIGLYSKEDLDKYSVTKLNKIL